MLTHTTQLNIDLQSPTPKRLRTRRNPSTIISIRPSHIQHTHHHTCNYSSFTCPLTISSYPTVYPHQTLSDRNQFPDIYNRVFCWACAGWEFQNFGLTPYTLNIFHVKIQIFLNERSSLNELQKLICFRKKNIC